MTDIVNTAIPLLFSVGIGYLLHMILADESRAKDLIDDPVLDFLTDNPHLSLIANSGGGWCVVPLGEVNIDEYPLDWQSSPVSAILAYHHR